MVSAGLSSATSVGHLAATGTGSAAVIVGTFAESEEGVATLGGLNVPTTAAAKRNSNSDRGGEDEKGGNEQSSSRGTNIQRRTKAELLLASLAAECAAHQRDVATQCFAAEGALFGDEKMWVPYTSADDTGTAEGIKGRGSWPLISGTWRLNASASSGTLGVNSGVGLYVWWYRLLSAGLGTHTSSAAPTAVVSSGYISYDALISADHFVVIAPSGGSAAAAAARPPPHPIVPASIEEVSHSDKEDRYDEEAFAAVGGPKTRALRHKLLHTPTTIIPSQSSSSTSAIASASASSSGPPRGSSFVLAEAAATLDPLQRHLFFTLFNHSIARRAQFGQFYAVRHSRKKMKRQPLPVPLDSAGRGLPSQHPFVTFHRNYLKPLEISWIAVPPISSPPLADSSLDGAPEKKKIKEDHEESGTHGPLSAADRAALLTGLPPSAVVPVVGVGYFQSHVSGASYTNMWHTFGDFYNLLFHTIGALWEGEGKQLATFASSPSNSPFSSFSLPITWVTRTPFSVQRKDCRSAAHCRSHSLFDMFRRAFSDKIVFLDDDGVITSSVSDVAASLVAQSSSAVAAAASQKEGTASGVGGGMPEEENSDGADSAAAIVAEDRRFFEGRRRWVRSLSVGAAAAAGASSEGGAVNDDGSQSHGRHRQLAAQARAFLPLAGRSTLGGASPSSPQQQQQQPPTFLHFEYAFVGLKNRCCPIPMTGVGVPLCVASYRRMRDYTLGTLYGLEPRAAVCRYRNATAMPAHGAGGRSGAETEGDNKLVAGPIAAYRSTGDVTVLPPQKEEGRGAPHEGGTRGGPSPAEAKAVVTAKEETKPRCVPPFVHIMSRQRDTYRKITPFDEMAAAITREAAGYHSSSADNSPSSAVVVAMAGTPPLARRTQLSPPPKGGIPSAVITLHGGMTFRQQLLSVHRSSLLVAGRGGGTALSLFLPLGGGYLSISGHDRWNPWRDMSPPWYHFGHYTAAFVHHEDPNRGPQLFGGGIDGNRAGYRVEPARVAEAVRRMLSLIDG